MYVCMYVCMYPSSAHSFGPIGMKLGMDIPWDAGNVIRQVASAKPEVAKRPRSASAKRKDQWSEATENASVKREAQGSEATAGVGKVALATREARQRGKIFCLHFYAFQTILSRLRHTFF